MALLQRSDWYDLGRSTNWTPRYVTAEQLFPEDLAGSFDIPEAVWNTYDEPYKVTYRDYVSVQREKDAGVYAVGTAAARTRFLDDADPRWHAVMKFHFAGASLGECISQIAESRMARFGRAGGMRNMATFGLLDEFRHGQLQLYFSHENVKRDVQYDWGHKLYHTNEWGGIMTRHVLEDVFCGNDAVTTAIQLTFAFETAFTNMQFLGMAADAAEAGDASFSNLISSIQTDEARHAQIGAPLLKLLIANGYKEQAQKMVDIGFWRTWRFFGVISGPSIDYYMPLNRRKSSFKEFVQEWIVDQFERNLADLGLAKPWYWDYFLSELDFYGHGMHMGIWMWRPTVFFNPPAGVTPDEREWLEEKYPGWNDSWGRLWDVVIENAVAGRENLTVAQTLPIICNMSQLPIVRDIRKPYAPQVQTAVVNGRRRYFQSEVDRWIYLDNPARYGDFDGLVDRMVTGQIMPPDLPGALAYMSLGAHDMGRDAHGMAWVQAYRDLTKKAA